MTILEHDQRGGVATLSLNRPDRHNAIDRALLGQLIAAIERATDATEVRVVVLRGNGPSFCSGVDTSGLGNRDEGEGHFSYLRRSQQLNLLISSSPKPVIAALHGHVLGKGLETALAADIRVVGDDARLGFPEVAFGLTTDNGGAARATVLAGPSRTKYLIMSGETIDASTAVDWGLGDILVGSGDLDDRVQEIATRIASRPPVAVSVAKELVDQVDRGAVVNGTRTEMLAQIALFGTDDHHEARAALRERRTPQYRGT